MWTIERKQFFWWTRTGPLHISRESALEAAMLLVDQRREDIDAEDAVPAVV